MISAANSLAFASARGPTLTTKRDDPSPDTQQPRLRRRPAESLIGVLNEQPRLASDWALYNISSGHRFGVKTSNILENWMSQMRGFMSLTSM